MKDAQSIRSRCRANQQPDLDSGVTHVLQIDKEADVTAGCLTKGLLFEQRDVSSAGIDVGRINTQY